ncbi:agamous-like MADS-box protein AGL97 [Brassica rapa]|uniref:agamous-like MADS-box protein AGL97 n=1 Tax=Brassica campestris TaxID=3711 RepID=UPI00142D1FDB|nr:agamous-like MADS-box protein AGL97 [Brassica rapa]
MVKRGGTKRKAEIKKITDKSSKAVTFTKRRDGLFSKAAQLCLLGDAQIAILATPSSSHSNVSFFSFGHSSVDSVVSAYLSGQRPAPPPVPEDSKEMREDIAVCMARKELGLGYWWEDEELLAGKSREEIMEAMESMQILWKAAERLREDEAIDFDQREGSLEKMEDMSNDQIIAVCDSFFNNNNAASLSATPHGEDDHHHQIEAVSENYCSNNMNALLSPAAAAGGGLNDQNLLDLDLANLDLDTIFEGLADLDAEFVASLLM